MPEAHSWIVARIENNRLAVALRFLDLAAIPYYAPRAIAFSSNRHELHPLFLNPYFFVTMTDGQWGPIKRSNGIASIVLRGDSPAIVPPAIIAALKSRENKNGLIDLRSKMHKGVRVAITQGPFTHYEGILACDPADRVKVLFDCILFGSQREVSFPRGAVTALR